MFFSYFSFWNCSGDEVVSSNDTNRDIIQEYSKFLARCL